jgi:hypothetical protein
MIQNLEVSNREVQERLTSLRREIAEQRREMARLEDESEPPTPLESMEVRHPLVPYTEEESAQP